MADADVQDQPLQQLFYTAQRLFAAAQSSAAPDASGTSSAQRAIDLLSRCTDAVERLSLFSSNEEKDDLATPDLKFLSIPYLQAELQAQRASTDMQERLSALQDAKQLHLRFLHRMQQYGLLEMQCIEALDRIEAGERTDATTTRSSKIAMFKREKDIKSQMEAITRQRLVAGGSAELDDDCSGQAIDEEGERDAWFLQLDLYAIKAVQQLASMQQELEMLRHVSNMPESERRAAAESNAPPPDLIKQLRSAAAGLESQRMTIRQNLLRPSHNLPTRSLAQQADIEIARAQEAAHKQEQAEAARASRAEIDEEDDDEAVAKQRARDDWNDEHPAGWGNSKLRPTA